MASRLSIVLFLVSVTIAISEARVIPAEPVSMVLDAYGNPVIFLREKRAPVRPFLPHRAMMMTGYYRPTRRSDAGDQATGVFAQGNAVSAGSYFSGVQPPYLKAGPEPLEEPLELSSANAEAGPEPASDLEAPQPNAPEDILHPGNNQENPEQHGVPEFENQPQEPAADPEVNQYDTPNPQSQQNPQEPAVAVEEAAQSEPEVPPPAKKGKKTPIYPAEEDDDEDFEEEEPYVPFVPAKPNRRQGYVPNLNNLFPMMFSFPGFGRRGGSASGTPPGVVTAIANSYSTGKGGVASSVATAYGGSPNGKKTRQAPVAQE